MLYWNWRSFQDLSNQELYDLLALRQAVFIEEQQCRYKDIDYLDKQYENFCESESCFEKFNNHLISTLKKNNIKIEKTYVCPHHPDEKCDCRKPNIKFIKEAEKEFNIDLKNSWVIGDLPCDIEMGKNTGCRTIYVLTGHGEKHKKDLNNIKPDFVAENIYEAAKIIIEQ